MLRMIDHGRRRTGALALVATMCLVACSSDDDGSSDEAPAQPEVSDDGAGDDGDDAVPAGDTSGLVVPLEYLQGEWCNSDGEAWVIEGETARFGENHDELVGELPVAGAFAGGPGILISQSDDEFVIDVRTREVTFTRGRC